MTRKFLVEIFDEQNDIKIDHSNIQKVAVESARREDQPFDEVHLHFVTKERICDLHNEFFSDPSPTDCISLPLDGPDEPYRILGEVFVCPRVAIEYAEEHSKETSVEKEILLYTIHGLLHLMGYDDMNEEDRIEMRKAEARNLKWLDY